jgi:fructokinase
MLPGGRQLGGAPANFTYHAHALGAEARLISRVGDDALGREAVQQLQRLGVPTECIEVDREFPTGVVTVQVNAEGQPVYEIHERVAWDAIRGESAGRKAVATASAICYGTLAQRSEPSHSSIRELVAATPAKTLRILDVNLRQSYFSPQLLGDSLALANFVKVNDAELPVLAQMFDLRGEVKAQITQLAERYELRGVAYTRGGHGSLLFSDGRWSDHPGVPAKIVDTVGAGDSFTAAMTLGWLAGWDLDRVNDHANQVAAYVCGCAGAMPELPAHLRDLFRLEPNLTVPA